MRVESIRWWQWTILGLVAGGLLGTARWAMLAQAQDWNIQGTETLTDLQIRVMLPLRHAPNGVKRVMTDVVVHPRKEGGYLLTCYVPKDYDRYMRAFRNKPGSEHDFVLPKSPSNEVAMIPAKFVADVPLVFRGVKDDPKRTILTYLDETLAKDRKTLEEKKKAAKGAKSAVEPEPLAYKFAWWETRNGVYALWGGGAFAAVGLVWPLVMTLLVGAGLGREPDPEYDLSRFKGSAKPVEVKKKTATEEDMARLAALEAEMEARLMKDAKPREAHPVAAAAPAPAIRKLESGSAAQEAKAGEAADPNKAFGIDREDFYPTEIHGKSKTD